jgi:ATP-dependent DNA helicase
MKLQNAVMQLRKVCSHPFLFDWPIDPKTHNPVLGEELVNASGKMMVLDRLLRELFERKHKVLIFSQFKIMLDIIQVTFLSCIRNPNFIHLGLTRIGQKITWAGLSIE